MLVEIGENWKLFQWLLHECGQKWAWSFSSWDPKICCILRMSLWIELVFACRLWCNNFNCTLYLWRLNATLLQLYLLTPPPHPPSSCSNWKDPMKGSVKGQSILPSCHLSMCFPWIGSLDFSKFQHGARNFYEVVCDRAWFFGKTFFAPEIEEMGQNLVINFLWIYSIMRIDIICCVPAQILYLVENLVPQIQAKMLSANQIAGFLNQLFLWNKLIEQSHFLHTDTNSQKLNVQKFYSWAWSKYGHGQSDTGL